MFFFRRRASAVAAVSGLQLGIGRESRKRPEIEGGKLGEVGKSYIKLPKVGTQSFFYFAPAVAAGEKKPLR